MPEGAEPLRGSLPGAASAAMKGIARARDRARAFEKVYSRAIWCWLPYEKEALVRGGRVVPDSMVAGHSLGEKVDEGPSEP